MADKSYQLVVRKGPRPGQLFPLTKEILTVGRDPLSDIVLNDSEISRHHADLTRAKDGYELKDLGSTNGSFVDGRRLSGESETLKPGQVIMFGSNVTLIYQAISDADPMATMVGAMAAMPPVDLAPAKAEPEPEPVIEPEPIIEPEPEPEPIPDPAEMGTIIDPLPEFKMPAADPEPAAPAPFTPAEEPDPYLPQVEPDIIGGTFGASDAAVEAHSPTGVPPLPPFTPSEPPAKSGGTNRNLIIGIVVGVVLLCCCCILIGFASRFVSGGFDLGANESARFVAAYVGQFLS